RVDLRPSLLTVLRVAAPPPARVEAGAAASAKSRILHLVDYGFRSLLERFLQGLVAVVLDRDVNRARIRDAEPPGEDFDLGRMTLRVALIIRHATLIRRLRRLHRLRLISQNARSQVGLSTFDCVICA